MVDSVKNTGGGSLLVMWYINAGVMMPSVEVVAHLMTSRNTNTETHILNGQFHRLYSLVVLNVFYENAHIALSWIAIDKLFICSTWEMGQLKKNLRYMGVGVLCTLRVLE